MEGTPDKFEATIAAIREDLGAIRLDLADIKERLAALPTTFQFVYILVGLTVAIFAAALGLLKLIGIH